MDFTDEQKDKIGFFEGWACLEEKPVNSKVVKTNEDFQALWDEFIKSKYKGSETDKKIGNFVTPIPQKDRKGTESDRDIFEKNQIDRAFIEKKIIELGIFEKKEP